MCVVILLANNTKVKNFTCNGYTLQYKIKKIDGENRAIIVGFKDITKDFEKEGHLVIPSVVKKLKVHAINELSFNESNHIKKLTIEEGVTHIGTGAFFGCYSLEEVNIPKSVIQIEGNAFNRCEKLKVVNFSEGLEVIGDCAFAYTGVEDVKLPDSLITICFRAFAGSEMRSLHMGQNVNTVGVSAFSNCKNLENIVFSERLRTIKDRAFSGCEKLEEIWFPDSVTTLGFGSLAYCYELKTLRLGPNVKDIISDYGCDEFAVECNNLEKIIVSPANETLKVIDGILYDIDKKTLIKAPCCNKVDTIKIPSWVKVFSDYCFEGVSVNNLMIKSRDIDNITQCGIYDVKNIYCIPGSSVESVLLSEGLEVLPMRDEISKFLDDIECKKKDEINYIN